MVIVYQSNTGFTQQYAEMLAKAEKLKLYSADEAQLDAETEVFYMGPLMAGRITGADKACKQYKVVGVCGVGMSPPGKDILHTISKANATITVPMFYLQGGWAPKKVGFIKRRAVQMVTKSFREALQAKSKRTEYEQQNLDMLLKGGSFVAYKNLDTIRSWMNEQ